jgi:excisionase family DNA binding protein
MVSDAAYISTREAAQLLGISLRTAQLWVESGALLAWKTSGGHRRILLSSVNKILEERKRLSLDPALANTPKLKVAIVEDDLDLLQLMALTIGGLEQATEVQTSTDGFRGLIMLGEFRPHVLITDLNMPDMDGFRMLQAIEGSEFSPAKLIITTALDSADIKARGFIPERAIVLHKPFTLSDLEQAVLASSAVPRAL